MDARFRRRTVAVTLSAGLIAALTTPVVAAPSPTVGATPTTAGMLDLASPQMLVAIQRDLGLSPTEAVDRLVREEAATRLEQKLRQRLGADFAGAWLTDEQQLVVAVTDPDHSAGGAGRSERCLRWWNTAPQRWRRRKPLWITALNRRPTR